MRRLTDWLFGFDFFISYSHADGRNYPRQLAARLRESDFAVFLDQEQYTAGEELNSATRRRVRMSKYLVVLVRPAVLKSRWVKKEVEESIDAGRAPLPVIGRWMLDHGGAVFLQETFGERIWIAEERAKEEESYDGEPSPDVVHELQRAFEGTRRNTLRRRMVTAAGVVMTALALIATAMYYGAETQRKATLASAIDVAALRRFAEADAREAEREGERERCTKLRRELAAAAATAGTEPLRGRVLTDEISQCEAYMARLAKAARELRGLGKTDLASAAAQWKAVDARIGGRSVERPTQAMAPAIFSIEFIKAPKSEVSILHYGDVDAPRFILLDGGALQVYKSQLKPRLLELRRNWGGREDRLPFELVIGSQTDFDRTSGLRELVRDAQDASRPYAIRGIWLNSALPLTRQSLAYVPARGKWRFLHDIVSLGTPINAPFEHFVSRPNDAAIRIALPDGLTITVLHPTPDRLRRFQKYTLHEWQKVTEQPDVPLVAEGFPQKLARVRRGTGSRPAAPRPPKANSTCPSPQTPTGRDTSVVNRASLVLLFEFRGRKLLYTGDATDQDILAGLDTAGLLDAAGTARVDILHIPHYGSDRNSTEELFRRIVADHYVITGNGRHGNPEIATLEMILAARCGEPYTMHFVHRAGSDDLEPRLNQFFIATTDRGHRRVFRAEDDQSLIVNLLQPVRY